MCGIAGWAGDPRGDRETLTRMLDALTHRGPDGDGDLIRAGKVALGFRRLAIIDLETGDQPLANEDETVFATCNGEIYNFRELRAGLEDRGHRFRTGSDCEVIVHLYEELGERCVDELQGMFAIAIWDARAERLVLLRDRLGVKPLYWAIVDGGLVYASEPGALLAGGLVQTEPDREAILRYLTLQYVPAPMSGLAGVRKLRPGERLVFQDGAYEVDRYWSLDYAHKVSGEDTLERLDALLGEATRDRLVSDVPLGAFLSGGIDSSLVVSYMAEALPQVRTFSIDFAEARFSEAEYAREVAALYGTEHEEFRLEPEMVPLISEAVRHVGEPFADASAIPTFLLSQVTRRHVTVALSGDGGDEAFAGYQRYVLAMGADRLLSAVPFARRAGDLPGLDRLPRRARRALGALGRGPLERYALMMSHFTPDALQELCTPELLADGGGPRRAWEETLALPQLPGVDRYLALDTATYLPDDLLAKVDRMSMANSLEVRSPFLDYRVQELAASLPPGAKLRRRRRGKWPLRQLARRRGLPDRLVNRPKQGFGVPLADWLRGSLRGWMSDILLDPGALGRGYFRPEAVRGLIDEHSAGRADHSTRLWNLTMLELWHREFIDA